MTKEDWVEIYKEQSTELVWDSIKDCLYRIRSNPENKHYVLAQEKIIAAGVEVLSGRN